MTCPGLPSGFVRFGTLAHKILLIAHDEGFVSQVSLQEREWPDLDNHPQAISANLKRMKVAGFLHVCGRVRDGGSRLHWLYQIEELPRHIKREMIETPRSVAERTRIYRKKKRLRVSSVFAFRGLPRL